MEENNTALKEENASGRNTQNSVKKSISNKDNENKSQAEPESQSLNVSNNNKSKKSKKTKSTKPKQQKRLTISDLNKAKRVKTSLLLFIYHLIPTICLILSHYVILSDLTKLENEHQSKFLVSFIVIIIISFILAGMVTYVECFQKIPVFNGILYIFLIICTIYVVVYIGLFYFEQIFCSMIVLVGGSFGIFILTTVSEDGDYSLFILLTFNLLCSAIAGIIMCIIYKNKLAWSIVFSSIAFLISEFNIYNIQTKITKKKYDKPPEIISQPFEFVISVFVIIYMVIKYLWKMIKKCFESCKKNKSESKEPLNQNNGNGEQEGEGEDGGNNEEGNEEGNEQNEN